jgi:hypothetical protein
VSISTLICIGYDIRISQTSGASGCNDEYQLCNSDHIFLRSQYLLRTSHMGRRYIHRSFIVLSHKGDAVCIAQTGNPCPIPNQHTTSANCDRRKSQIAMVSCGRRGRRYATGSPIEGPGRFVDLYVELLAAIGQLQHIDRYLSLDRMLPVAKLPATRCAPVG